jgi:hypothetical protein
VAPPVFKTGLAAIAVAGGFDSLPPPILGWRTGARSVCEESEDGTFLGEIMDDYKVIARLEQLHEDIKETDGRSPRQLRWSKAL